MSTGYRRWRLVAFVAIGVFALGYIASCIQWSMSKGASLYGTPFVEVVYVNATDQPIQLYCEYNNSGRVVPNLLVEPHSRRSTKFILSGLRTVRIVAERPDGRRVYDRTFDDTYPQRELRDFEGSIVISSLEPID